MSDFHSDEGATGDEHGPQTHEDPSHRARTLFAPLTDFSFTTAVFPRVLTPTTAKALYIFAIVASVLGWLVSSITKIAIGAATVARGGGAGRMGGRMGRGPMGADWIPGHLGHGMSMLVCGVVELLLGWIAVGLVVLLVRMGLEMILRLAGHRPRASAQEGAGRTFA